MSWIFRYFFLETGQFYLSLFFNFKNAYLFCNPSNQSQRAEKMTPRTICKQTAYQNQPREQCTGNSEFSGIKDFERIDRTDNVYCSKKCDCQKNYKEQNPDSVRDNKRYFELSYTAFAMIVASHMLIKSYLVPALFTSVQAGF